MFYRQKWHTISLSSILLRTTLIVTSLKPPLCLKVPRSRDLLYCIHWKVPTTPHWLELIIVAAIERCGGTRT